MRNRKRIAILGSTGSIGTQALQVIEEHADLYEPYVLTAHSRADLLIAQARKFHPSVVVIADENHYLYVKDALADLPVQVYAGDDALCQVVQNDEVDIVLTALVGFSGLRPTLAAIRSRKQIALANKETLVVAGELVTQAAIENHCTILPVDSEHSAIFQCLTGENQNEIEKIILTASGGPFRQLSMQELQTVTPEMALRHPNWDMGAKITIDSATMMNKGFEVIEARWLFGVSPDEIQVVVHPQSIIHSAVQFRDGSVKAQLGMPDMRIPIQLALSYPERLLSSFARLNWSRLPGLTFEEPDLQKFPCLSLAYDAMSEGGTMPCIMNAANEVANLAFRRGECSFLQIPDIIERTMRCGTHLAEPVLEDYFEVDAESRMIAREILSHSSSTHP